MGSSLSIYNATDLILDTALSQVGPLYYENKLQPGKLFRRKVGKVWFTINAKIYTGDQNIYTDWSVAAPIILPLMAPIISLSAAKSSPEVNVTAAAADTYTFGTTRGVIALTGSEGAGTELRFSPAVGEMSADRVAGVISKCNLSSPGWYVGSDRTLYICGGTPGLNVQRDSESFQIIEVDGCELPALYISEEPPKEFKPID